MLNGVRRTHTKGNKGRKLKCDQEEWGMSRKVPQRRPPTKSWSHHGAREGRVMNIYGAPPVYQALGECFTQTISF